MIEEGSRTCAEWTSDSTMKFTMFHPVNLNKNWKTNKKNEWITWPASPLQQGSCIPADISSPTATRTWLLKVSYCSTTSRKNKQNNHEQKYQSWNIKRNRREIRNEQRPRGGIRRKWGQNSVRSTSKVRRKPAENRSPKMSEWLKQLHCSMGEYREWLKDLDAKLNYWGSSGYASWYKRVGMSHTGMSQFLSWRVEEKGVVLITEEIWISPPFLSAPSTLLRYQVLDAFCAVLLALSRIVYTKEQISSSISLSFTLIDYSLNGGILASCREKIHAPYHFSPHVVLGAI